MILPGKHIRLSRCLLNIGAMLLLKLDGEYTVSMLWDSMRARPEINTFQRFVLGLDLLFVLGLVRFNARGLLERTR